ncbi:hypothetical protein V6N13_112745 [Hibiscus sabdariffa]
MADMYNFPEDNWYKHHLATTDIAGCQFASSPTYSTSTSLEATYFWDPILETIHRLLFEFIPKVAVSFRRKISFDEKPLFLRVRVGACSSSCLDA